MANTRKISDEQVVAAYLVKRIEKYAYFDRGSPKVKSFDYASRSWRRKGGEFLDHLEKALPWPIDWNDYSLSEHRIANLYGVNRSTLNRRIKKWSPDSVKGFLKNKSRRKKVAKFVSRLFYSLPKRDSNSNHVSDRIKIDAVKDKFPIEFWIALFDLISEGIYKNILSKMAAKTGIEFTLLEKITDEFLSFDRDDIWSNFDEQKVLENQIEILNNCGAKMTAKYLKASLTP
ncbi:MAG: hypothetical protein CEE38_07860 [Planctomycetes bacterium B3_Pla]|nr:MAG: hypothetical protein CEE38_07860 [Planctomycetes bacterium B3_Pla]